MILPLIQDKSENAGKNLKHLDITEFMAILLVMIFGDSCYDF